MTLRLAVDTERLVADYLMSRSELTALMPGGVVGHDVAAMQTFPCVRVWRAGGTAVAREHLDRPIMHVETWGALEQAQRTLDLMTAVRAAMNNDPLDLGGIVGTHTLGVVASTTEIAGVQWLPDPVTKRPRYLWLVQVRVHPGAP